MTTQTATAQVNGIDVAALKQTIADIEAQPQAGQTRWTVTSRWQGGTRTDHFVDGVDIGGQRVDRRFQIEIDEPCELCGTNQYANPQEYLLAATNACMMVGYATVAAVMGIELSKLELQITGDIDLRGFLDIDASVARGYERLHYTVRVAGDGTQEQFEKLHEVVQRTSPNYYNMANPVELTSDLVVE
ncbi:OsmC family protein [Aeoliella sp.]|uniref:OsmC family protein n=1 Tax=Aeoliella sp. TaxID=2795800 RepID=UPI003CCB9A2A